MAPRVSPNNRTVSSAAKGRGVPILLCCSSYLLTYSRWYISQNVAYFATYTYNIRLCHAILLLTFRWIPFHFVPIWLFRGLPSRSVKKRVVGVFWRVGLLPNKGVWARSRRHSNGHVAPGVAAPIGQRHLAALIHRASPTARCLSARSTLSHGLQCRWQGPWW